MTTETLAPWQYCWRQAVAPNLTRDGLLALRRALITNSPVLLFGATTSPPPLQCVQDWPCEACCALALAALEGDDPDAHTVADVEEKFTALCMKIDELLGQPAAFRDFLNWVDDGDPNEVRAALLVEVNRTLHERTGVIYDAA